MSGLFYLKGRKGKLKQSLEMSDVRLDPAVEQSWTAAVAGAVQGSQGRGNHLLCLEEVPGTEVVVQGDLLLLKATIPGSGELMLMVGPGNWRMFDSEEECDSESV